MVQSSGNDDNSEGPTTPTGMKWHLQLTWARTQFRWNQLKWILKNFRRWRDADASIEAMKERYLAARRQNEYPDPDPALPDSWFSNFLRLYDAALERRDLGQLTVWWEYHDRADMEFRWRAFWTSECIGQADPRIGKVNRALFGVCIRYKLDVGPALKVLESIPRRWPEEVQFSHVNNVLVHLIEQQAHHQLGDRKYDAEQIERTKRWKTPGDLYDEIRKEASEITPKGMKLPINVQYLSVWDMPDDTFRAFLMTRWSDIDLRLYMDLP